MGPRYKVTGCARFFIFLVIFVPAVFFGAAYLRGENGVQIIKDFYHKLVGKNDTSSSYKSPDETLSVEELQRQLKEAQQKIEELEQKVKDQQVVIEELKK